jgi:SAM-dependent methyltransferase
MKCKICGGKLRPWIRKLFDDRHGYPGKFDVYKCSFCEFGQTVPQLSGAKIAEIYSKYYPWKNTDIKNVKLSDFKIPNKMTIWRKGLFINGQYSVKKGAKVLDVGCGLGYSLLELKNYGCKAYGIDPDKNALKLAKKFNLNFKKGFITDNVFVKEKFDYIIANQVLEHTNDPLEFLTHCKNRLSKNGKIILSFPNANSLTRYLFKNNWLHWHIPYHLNFFTRKSIEIVANHAGLKIDSIKTETPNMWMNLQIRRLTQKPKIGVRDTFWDGKPDNDSQLTQGIYPKLVHFAEEYNLLNRVIDLFGFGESFILTLSNA